MTKQQQQQQHPITPPPELVQEWAHEHQSIVDGSMYVEDYIATQTARYRQIADAELEACCEYMQHEDFHGFARELRLARRPKPPSLAEQGLEALEQIDGWAVANMNHLSIHDDLVTGVEAIHRALERLQELEKGNE